MSKAAEGLSDDAADVKRLVAHMGAMRSVNRVFLCGSRSPASHRVPHDGSDWDIMPETVDPPYLPRPRLEPWNLHVDILYWNSARDDMVEVWPNDPEGIFAMIGESDGAQ